MSSLIVSQISIEDFESRLEKVIQSALTLAEVKKESNPDLEVFLTRKEAAKLLRISLPTLTRYVKAGIVPAVILGNEYRFNKANLLDCMKAINEQKYRRGES